MPFVRTDMLLGCAGRWGWQFPGVHLGVFSNLTSGTKVQLRADDRQPFPYSVCDRPRLVFQANRVCKH